MLGAGFYGALIITCDAQMGWALLALWLTANLLGEAASDLRSRKPTRWGGREYEYRGDKARVQAISG